MSDVLDEGCRLALERVRALARDGLLVPGSKPRFRGPHRHPAVARRARMGRVYFIEAIGAERIKIGFTSGDPAVRLRDLQTACPFMLRVIAHVRGSMDDEAALHERFASTRAVPGTEWFHITHELRAHIQHLVEVDS